MKIATYNIQYGRGRDGRFDLDRIADAVSGARRDRVPGSRALLVPIRRRRSAAAARDPLSRALPGVRGRASICISPERNRMRRAPGGGSSGTCCSHARRCSRYATTLLPKYGSLGPLSLQRSALEGVIAVRDGHVRLYSVHLTHLSAETRLPQIETLLKVHGERGARRSAGIGRRPARGMDPRRDAAAGTEGGDPPRRLQHGAGFDRVRAYRGAHVPLRRPDHEPGRLRRCLGGGRQRRRRRDDGRDRRPPGPARLLLRQRRD